jgi:L-ascorbate metabolism protein UlaG (beta-lactamase superfamily)
MRITKFGHACVRVEQGGQSLVIDPGGFSEPESVEGVSAVLVTHEHPDHLDIDNLRRCDVPVFAGSGVAAALAEQAPDVAERLREVSAGEEFVVAGMRVGVCGELHALIHEDVPRVVNTGYCIENEVFHPGDSFTSPPQPVSTLLTPLHAPWMRLAEAVDFARTACSARVIAIHDGFLNDDGLALSGRMMSNLLGGFGLEYRRLRPGEDV